MVVAASATIYANTLSFGAAWDDTRFVFESGATGGVRAIPEMFAHPLVRDVPAGRGAYRPLTAASYALDWTLGGGQARFFHWTNVGLHAAVTGGVLALLLALGASRAGALAGALVFGVHPVHAEAVANLAGRSELLAALFSVSAVLVYVRGRSRADPGSAPDHALGGIRSFAVVALLCAALLSKEHAIAVPVLLVAVEALDPRRREGLGARLRVALRTRWPVWAGMAGVVLGYLSVRRSVLGTLTTWDVAPFIAVLTPLERATSAVANWTHYVRLHVFPLDLSVDYGPAIVMPSTPADLRFWVGATLGVAAGVGAFLAYRRHHRLVTLGLVWFVVVMLPVSNLLVPIAQWLAERFLYLPSVGSAILLAGLTDLAAIRLHGRERRVAAVAAALGTILLASRTWTRNRAWEDTPTVVATLITEHPEAFRSQWLLGRFHFERGRVPEAMTALDSAIALNPNAIELPLERVGWLLALGRASEAEAIVRALPALRHADREAHLARALLAQDRPAEADSVLAAARAAFPANRDLAALADSAGASARR